MKASFLLTGTFLLLTAAVIPQSSTSKMTPVSTTVKEVVTYRVHPSQAGNLNLIRDHVSREAAAFDGFISRTVRQSTSDSTLFMDIVIWENMETAISAAEQMPGLPQFAPFMEAIAEVVSFHHFQEQ